MRILIVEDDPVLRDGLQVGLQLSGLQPDAVSNCADAELALLANDFSAVVLDIMLPDGSGLDVLRAMRDRQDQTPVLLLTARDDIADRIAGLDQGADDYLGKPFDLDELAARLRALLRRGAGRATPVLAWRNITLDPATLEVRCAGAVLALTRREFSLLHYLMERPGQVCAKRAIEEALYGWQEGVESNTVEVHIHHLRAKLGSGVIETVRGLGYRLGSEP
ncbi:transcriptional regulator [Devosia epidermidihirudinis]|uniref:Transcriptional regulator n=1 Tax=Devosia epidermidihirudinis TaxID=1293439 RepID=A0A0F5QLT6_9HYPH|nr:response regulator transcription factor [Devosia epidermidihirudinis]KKC41004.1 transcriptional regulator [Devosia epidermidihirudinis]